ncbi:MAG: OmpP1/FadL family transporter, partial [Polyangia bacterium]
VARPAAASEPEVFGLGSEESAVAGASAARVHDFSAGYYDPAGLTLAHRPEASIGVIGFGSRLPLPGGGNFHMTDRVGILVGAATPVPFTGVLADRLFVGVALHLLPDTIVRVIAHTPDQPFYPLYDNRTQRLVILPAVAARLWRGLSLGLGFNYLAGLGGNVAATEGATRALEARVDEQIYSELAVNVGLRWQLDRALALALVYRQAFGVPFRSVARNDIAGQPIDLDVDAEELYTPHTIVAGAAWRARPSLLLSLDVAWLHWSGWRGPYVTVTSELPLVGGIATEPPHVAFTDGAAVRAGVDWTTLVRGAWATSLRGGYAFESSPLPSTQTGTQLVDGHKHHLTLGLGARVAVFGGELRFDVHGALQIVQGPSTGLVGAGGFTLTVRR